MGKQSLNNAGGVLDSSSFIELAIEEQKSVFARRAFMKN